MKKQQKNSTRAFALRIALALALTSISAILLASTLRPPAAGPQPDRPAPDVVALVGPVSQDLDLRALRYVAPTSEEEEIPLRRHPFPLAGGQIQQSQFTQQLMQRVLTPIPNMPSPILTFAGMNSTQSGCGCLPPDSDGDVGPNHYVNSVNSSIKIFDKLGNPLNGTNGTTYNSFFSGLGAGNPCGNNNNDGDGIVFYDHMADRWVVSDFAFPAFPGTSFWQCIGVSKTSNPVSGGWWLYAIQVDPANPSYLGDYPKFGMWPDAYYLSMNEFSNNTTFNGVRVYALDRNSMVNGGSAHAIGFSILPANLGNQYSLVPASFRTGNPPPAGQPEWFMDVNSSSVAGTVETQVFVRRFHVDFATPANSTFGVGATHSPDGIITVNGFKDAFNASTSNIVPNGTTTANQRLDTLGDKIMYPLIYQNRGGTESIYADQTILLATDNTLTGPTAVRWYQFNMTGNTIPATPAQQQDWNNGADGLFRWMPSINVDRQGNVAIGYSTSSTTLNPEIRYAGRLAGDPPNNMSQGEATLITAGGHQTSTSGRWGDYSTMFVDPTDSCTFWHVNEYYTATSSAGWATRIGSFKFPGCAAATPTLTYSHSHSHRYTYGNSYSDSHVYSDRYGDLYAYCHCDIHAYGYSYIYTYGDGDLYTDSNGYVYAYGDSYVYTDRYGDLYAYCHCDIHTYGYSYVYTYCHGYIYTDSYGYVYAYCHCDIHTYGDCTATATAMATATATATASYSDANTNASCADGIERYQPDYQQLYCELDQCQRCEQLPVRRIHEQYLWQLRGISGSDCRRTSPKP